MPKSFASEILTPENKFKLRSYIFAKFYPNFFKSFLKVNARKEKIFFLNFTDWKTLFFICRFH